MSLNNQIFSLRQAIIKAKRKAKNEGSSDAQASSSEQSIDKKRPINNLSLANSKSFEKSRKQHENQQQQVKDSNIDTIAKDLYSSRKKKLLQSQNKSSQKKPGLSESLNRSPLTYSNTFRPLNGQQSRVSNFTVNSQISSKTRIHEKMTQLRKIIPDRPSTTSQLNNFDASHQQKNQSINQSELYSQFDQQYSGISDLQNDISQPDYVVSYRELEIPSLFSKINKKVSTTKKGLTAKQPLIHQMIAQWKELKAYHGRQVQNY